MGSADSGGPPARQSSVHGGIARADRAGSPDHDAHAAQAGPLSGEELAGWLMGSRSSVTALLEGLAREPIVADVRSQVIELHASPTSLRLAPGSTVLHRAVVLKGRTSGRPFVYARSAIAADRLPERIRWQLEHTEHPIGRILETSGISTQRSAVGLPLRPWRFTDFPEGGLDDAVLARRYVIAIEGQPVFDICEWFLAASAAAMEGR